MSEEIKDLDIKILEISQSPVSGSDIYNIIIQINGELYTGLVIKKDKIKEVII
jgi:hypothetical protein